MQFNYFKFDSSLLQSSLGVAAPNSALLFVILCPVGPYFKSGFKPVSFLADPKYVCAWPGGCGAMKMGANYAPTIQIQVSRGIPLKNYGSTHANYIYVCF